MRLRVGAAGAGFTRLRARPRLGLSPLPEALHGRVDVRPGPDRPLLRARRRRERQPRLLLSPLRAPGLIVPSPWYALLMAAGVAVSAMLWKRIEGHRPALLSAYLGGL